MMPPPVEPTTLPCDHLHCALLALTPASLGPPPLPPQYFDYLHCLDKCVAPKLFAQIK